MLQRDSGALTIHQFHVTVELEDGRMTHEQASMKLADALAWVEGTGEVNVDYLGTIERPEDEDEYLHGV